MKIETPEIRGRIINSAIFLEDELDLLILKFMTPQFKLTLHQISTFDLIKKHFIEGKTLGWKITLVRDIISSDIFKNQYFNDLIEFFKINNLGIQNDYNSYEDFFKDLNLMFERVIKVRNAAAHGEINYCILMSKEEIKESENDKEFIYKNKIIKVSKKKEVEYNNYISRLVSLVKFMRMIIVL